MSVKKSNHANRPTITRPFVSWYCENVYIIDATRKGSVQVCKFLDCENADGKTYLCNVYTHPLYRRRGIATRLINAAKRYCQRKDTRSLYVCCYRNMMPFYEKCGFEDIHHTDKDKQGIPYYTMVCTIPPGKKPNPNPNNEMDL